jgi:hypothetical protein
MLQERIKTEEGYEQEIIDLSRDILSMMQKINYFFSGKEPS